VCASSLKAITLAAQTIQLGHADIVIAGGTESMSNAPNYTFAKPSSEGKAPQPMTNGLISDGLTDAFGKKEHMGVKGELCAKTYNISREQQDNFAIKSYRKAQTATENGWFRGEIAPIKVVTPDKKLILMKNDECISKVPLTYIRRMGDGR
jgi:acetyl-CoA C-acetyltransferase